jgi:hypothetical protein
MFEDVGAFLLCFLRPGFRIIATAQQRRKEDHHLSPRGGEEVAMASDTDLTALVDEIRQASGAFERGDNAVNRRVDKLETSINELFRKTSRPGAEWVVDVLAMIGSAMHL